MAGFDDWPRRMWNMYQSSFVAMISSGDRGGSPVAATFRA